FSAVRQVNVGLRSMKRQRHGCRWKRVRKKKCSELLEEEFYRHVEDLPQKTSLTVSKYPTLRDLRIFARQLLTTKFQLPTANCPRRAAPRSKPRHLLQL